MTSEEGVRHFMCIITIINLTHNYCEMLLNNSFRTNLVWSFPTPNVCVAFAAFKNRFSLATLPTFRRIRGNRVALFTFDHLDIFYLCLRLLEYLQAAFLFQLPP